MQLHMNKGRKSKVTVVEHMQRIFYGAFIASDITAAVLIGSRLKRILFRAVAKIIVNNDNK